ncbi:MAG: hypothetical protein ABI807_06820 [Sporichthyaceae bacterium]
MRIIINDVTTPGDLLAAIGAVGHTLVEPGAWEVEEHVFSKTDPATEAVGPPAADGQTVAVQVDDAIGRYTLVPCPKRGGHLSLVDCWMCWSDVHPVR